MLEALHNYYPWHNTFHSKYHLQMLSVGGNGTTGKYSRRACLVSLLVTFFMKTVQDPIGSRFSTLLNLCPMALVKTHAMSLLRHHSSPGGGTRLTDGYTWWIRAIHPPTHFRRKKVKFWPIFLENRRFTHPLLEKYPNFLAIYIPFLEKYPYFSEIHPPTCRGIFHFYPPMWTDHV